MKGGQDERKGRTDGTMNSEVRGERDREHVEIKAGGIKHNQVAAMKERN